MRFPIQRALPFLLASSSSNTLTSTKRTTTTSTTTTTTTATWPPQSPADLTALFTQEYKDLEQPGLWYRQVTPTLRFSYVTPPVNGTSTWRNSSSFRLDELQNMHQSQKKPVALYLPGLDGYGISAHQYQFDDLASAFHFWRLTIDGHDRSDFLSVVNSIVEFVEELHTNYSSPVLLMGESCGGVLAAAAALKLQQSQTAKNQILQGLVLVNPATSFDQTNWDRLVPLLTSLQYFEPSDSSTAIESTTVPITPYAVLGSLILSTLVPDTDQFRRIVDLVANLQTLTIPPSSPEQIESVWTATATGFRETERRLPPSLLSHRINWLVANAGIVRRRLSNLQVPALVVVGQQDKLLPSRNEVDHLASTIPNCETLVVRNRGHFVLDQNVNLTEAILYSAVDPLNRKSTTKPYDPILDWKLPPHDQVMETIRNSTATSRAIHSPVFISSDKKGRRTMGLGQLPKSTSGRPLLFVGNHQFAAADLRIVVAELYEQRRIVTRGLAHPITFALTKDRPMELGRRIPGIRDGDDRTTNPFNGDFEEYGAVEVTPKNYYRLMQSGQNALLFPGGAKEALSGRTDYPLFWPTKTDFVRTAAKFNAIVIPLSAVGMVDSVNVVAESHQLVDAPFLGEYIRAFSSNLTAARYDDTRTMNANEDVLGFPLAIPTLPARNYFLFGKPFDLESVNHKDKVECQRVYLEIQAEVRRGLDDLVRVRKHDPYGDAPKRLVYERVFGKPAPTFSIAELN